MPFFDFRQFTASRHGYTWDVSTQSTVAGLANQCVPGIEEAVMQVKNTNQFNTGEHLRLHQLLQRFQSLKAANPSGAKQAFEEFKAGMERHIRQEEMILFPCFEHKCDGRRFSPIDALKRDHGQILNYLDDIARKLASADFDTAAEEQNLESALDFHSQSEEEELFPVLDELLTEEERTIICETLDRCQ
jgi:iron-sulfur cluster repair protein YtfE (RIC family)